MQKQSLQERIVNRLGTTTFVVLWFGWFLFGQVLLFFYTSMLYQQFEARHYVKTTGTITMNNRHRMKNEDGVVSYEAYVRYTYFVDGHQYWNDRPSFLDKNVASSISPKIVDQYPTGKPIAVFYNPHNPGESVLTKKIKPIDVLPLLIFFPFAYSGVMPILSTIDDLWGRLRWKKIGDCWLIEGQDGKKALLLSFGIFSQAGLFAAGATMICVLFLLPYFQNFEPNNIVVMVMAGFIGISGVFGWVHAQRNVHNVSKMLIIDLRNGIVTFPAKVHIGQPSATFFEIISIDVVENNTGETRMFELKACCRQNGSKIRHLIVTATTKKTLDTLQHWIEHEIRSGYNTPYNEATT